MPVASSGICMGCMSPLGDVIVCPHCGYDNGAPYNKQYRKPGSTLGGRYIIGRLAKKNGEGAVYLGYDNSLQARVWIREYFPYTIALRDPLTGNVHPRQGYGAQFKALLSDFIDICNEVKRMGVTEPVIPIENVVGEHGTVYAIYKDIGVMELEAWLNRKGGKLPVGEARKLLLPLFNTLSNIHSRGIIHRGISPHTVYISKNGTLYLWDFCMSAARTGGSELDAELFNGYSAPEQYATNGWQGTWTDVYAAAALFYRTVSGFVPPKSTLIGPQRPLAPLVDLVVDLPKNISDAVVEAMDPSAEQRTQEIGAFISRLVNTELSSTAVYDVNKVNEIKKDREQKRRIRAEKRRRVKYVTFGLLITVALLGTSLYVVMKTHFPDLISVDGPVDRPGINELPSDPEESEDPTDDVNDKIMPDLTGLVAEAVINNPAYDGRFVFSLSPEFNAQHDEGVIYDQSPRAGVVVPDGRTVILYVSKGKEMFTMPNIIGKTRAEVDEIFAELFTDFDVLYNSYEKTVLGAEPGTVVSTTPVADTEFDPRDTRIDIFFMPNAPAPTQPTRNEESQSSSSSTSRRESSRVSVDDFINDWYQ